jgi:hypothetical protein
MLDECGKAVKNMHFLNSGGLKRLMQAPYTIVRIYEIKTRYGNSGHILLPSNRIFQIFESPRAV